MRCTVAILSDSGGQRPFVLRPDLTCSPSLIHRLCDSAAVQAENIAVDNTSGQATLTGGVFFEIDGGVLVKADKAVIKDREVSLEGNVRLTLPRPK